MVVSNLPHPFCIKYCISARYSLNLKKSDIRKIYGHNFSLVFSKIVWRGGGLVRGVIIKIMVTTQGEGNK